MELNNPITELLDCNIGKHSFLEHISLCFGLFVNYDNFLEVATS